MQRRTEEVRSKRTEGSAGEKSNEETRLPFDVEEDNQKESKATLPSILFLGMRRLRTRVLGLNFF